MFRFTSWFIRPAIWCWCCWCCNCCSCLCCWSTPIIWFWSPTTELWPMAGCTGKTVFQLVLPGAGRVVCGLTTLCAAVGRCSCWYQQNSPLIPRRQYPLRKLLHIMSLGWTRFLWNMSSFLVVNTCSQTLHENNVFSCEACGVDWGLICLPCTYQQLSSLSQSGNLLHFFLEGWSLSLLWFIIETLSLNFCLQLWQVTFSSSGLCVVLLCPITCSQFPSHPTFWTHSSTTNGGWPGGRHMFLVSTWRTTWCEAWGSSRACPWTWGSTCTAWGAAVWRARGQEYRNVGI